MAQSKLRRAHELVLLKGDEKAHEQTDAWSNRDLIPLPPSRRTWGWFSIFGVWTLSSLNISTWQTPNTFLTQGLSIGQAMAMIVISRVLIVLFAIFVAWCGIKWHVGFTVQNRISWGFRASYIPLLQRILLNFIWTAVQCWNGGKLATVCIVAIWPSFAQISNGLPASLPTTTYEMIGFFVFWAFSLPFLFIRPEKFKTPFMFTSIFCGLSMIGIMIWSLAVAKGVGPIFTKGEALPENSAWNTAWLMMSGINSAMGQKAAGMTNASDFSRYAKRRRDYLIGTISCYGITGVLVSFAGLITTGACQKIYGTIYWNPPDLMMRIMEDGQGTSAARAGVFFVALGFGTTAMFENVCSNAVAGGIDLSGLFPRYIDIRRGAFITFMAVWIVQPWQLVNRAASFITVLNSFSVFLSPIMGVMVCDFFILRHRKIKLTHLFHPDGSDYWFWHGINLRVLPAWIAGWAPTIGGLILSVQGTKTGSRLLFELYYIAFFLGFFISFLLFWAINLISPPPGLGSFDDVDIYGTFTPAQAKRLGVASLDVMSGEEILGEKSGVHVHTDNATADDSDTKKSWWGQLRSL